MNLLKKKIFLYCLHLKFSEKPKNIVYSKITHIANMVS